MRRAGDFIFCRPFNASVRLQAKGYLLPLKDTADFAQLLPDTLRGYFPLANHSIRVNDPLGQEMLKWRQKCQDTIRLNTHKINRVWPSIEEELWYTNVKGLNQDMTAEQAARHIHGVHEKNTYLRR